MRIQQFFLSRKEFTTTTRSNSINEKKLTSTRRFAYESKLNKYMLLFIVIRFPIFLSANFIGMNHGARAMAMGNAYIALADEPTAIFVNPAGLTKIDLYYLKASHQNLYGITDLYNDMVAFSAPVPYARLGFAWTQISLTNEYSEQVFYLSAASIIHTLGIPVRFGTSLKYEKISVMNYEGADNPSNYDLNAGIMIDVRKNLSYMPDIPFLYGKLTGEEFLRFVGGLHSMEEPILSDTILIAERCFSKIGWDLSKKRSWSFSKAQTCPRL